MPARKFLLAALLLPGVAAQADHLPAAGSKRMRDPFDAEEIDRAIFSLKDLEDRGEVTRLFSGTVSGMLEDNLREFIERYGHGKPNDWPAIEAAAEKLETLLGAPGEKKFDRLFHRILDDGQWQAAAEAARKRPKHGKPWVVLVGGVEGVRKTATIFQPWWPNAVHEALGIPENLLDEHELDPIGTATPTYGDIPSGRNSFIMPYDTIVATLANALMISLYRTSVATDYLNLKEAIWERYATLANIFSALLLKHAKAQRMNVVFMSSGADTRTYEYVEHFFPSAWSSFYRKLTVYLDIDKISAAERSVRERLECEKADGRTAVDPELEIWEADMRILANRGGPNGPLALARMQHDSRKVWQSLSDDSGVMRLGPKWLKAHFDVLSSFDEPWRLALVPPPGEKQASAYEFVTFGEGVCEEGEALRGWAAHDAAVSAWKDKVGSWFGGGAEQAPKCDEEDDDTWADMGRRRLAAAAVGHAQSESDEWYEEWQERLGCWWLGLAAPTQSQLGNCMGALGIHLGSRLDAAWRAAHAALGRAPPPLASGAAVAEPRCEWVRETDALELPSFPALPQTIERFQLPPIPRLLPSWEQLQSLLEQQQQLQARAPASHSQRWAALGAGVAMGVAVGAVLTIFIHVRTHTRPGVAVGRMQIRKGVPDELS